MPINHLRRIIMFFISHIVRPSFISSKVKHVKTTYFVSRRIGLLTVELKIPSMAHDILKIIHDLK